MGWGRTRDVRCLCLKREMASRSSPSPPRPKLLARLISEPGGAQRQSSIKCCEGSYELIEVGYRTTDSIEQRLASLSSPVSHERSISAVALRYSYGEACIASSLHLLVHLYPPPLHHLTVASSPALTSCPPPIPAAAPPSPSSCEAVVSRAQASDQTSPVWSRRVERAEPGEVRSQSLIVPSAELAGVSTGQR